MAFDFVLGKAQQGTALGAERQIRQLVNAGEKPGIGEAGYARYENVTNKVAGVFQDAIEGPHDVRHGGQDLGTFQVFGHGRVALVDQYDDLPVAPFGQSLNQRGQHATRRRSGRQGYALPPRLLVHHMQNVIFQAARIMHVAYRHIQQQHRILSALPVPAPVPANPCAVEKRALAQKQRTQGR